MENINQVILRGSVGNIRIQTFDRTSIAHFSLATNYAYKCKDGCAVIETQWHNITAWQNGEQICNIDAITKGSTVYVEGRLRYQKYMGVDGVERGTTEIVASVVKILE